MNKEEDIRIISAKDLSEAEKERVIQSIKKNKPDVRFKLTYEVDPAILGGLQIYAGTDFLDCSLRSRIEKLKTELGRIAWFWDHKWFVCWMHFTSSYNFVKS